VEEEKDERILNLLRLKMELEKDLQKRGVKQTDHPKRSFVPPKVKVSIEEDLNVPVNEIWSLYDLNRFTYGEDELLIEKSVQKRIISVEDKNQRLILEKIVHLLKGDYDGCVGLSKKSDQYLDSIDLIADLYKNQTPPVEKMVALLRNYSSSPVALLSAGEVLLSMGRFREVAKLFKIAYETSKDPYILLLTSAYDSAQIDGALFANCASKGNYKLLVLLISALTEDENKADKVIDVIKKKQYTCVRYIVSRANLSIDELFPFCPRSLILNNAIQFMETGRFDEDLISTLSKHDPQAYLLLLSNALRHGDLVMAREILSMIINSSEGVSVTPVNKSKAPVCLQSVVSMRKPMGKSILIDDPDEGLTIIQKSIEQFGDVYVTFKDIEFLRLYYGERFCKNNYLQEGSK